MSRPCLFSKFEGLLALLSLCCVVLYLLLLMQELLAAVDSRRWKSLAKRRVQHYGYEFLYEVSLIL